MFEFMFWIVHVFDCACAPGCVRVRGRAFACARVGCVRACVRVGVCLRLFVGVLVVVFVFVSVCVCWCLRDIVFMFV